MVHRTIESLIDTLIEDFGYQVILIHHMSTGPKHKNGLVNMTGETNDIRKIGAVLKMCDILISTDNGIYHYAHAVDTPSIVVFTLVRPSLRIKYYDKVKALWYPEDSGCPCEDQFRTCPTKGCVYNIKVSDIVDGVKQMLGERQVSVKC
jgi:ADP-heptose:LPS heptosyltransferase